MENIPASCEMSALCPVLDLVKAAGFCNFFLGSTKHPKDTKSNLPKAGEKKKMGDSEWEWKVNAMLLLYTKEL